MKKIDEKLFKWQVLGLISTDRKHPTTTDELTMRIGISVRELKSIIFELRKDFPICSKVIDGGGYWMAEDAEDIRDFISLMESRIWSTKKTIDRMQYHFEKMVD